MLQTFSILKSTVTSHRRSTESYVFYLHYRVTFLLLMFACLLVSSRHFIGDKIKCLSGHHGDISVGLLEAYCWAASTYSVTSAYLKEVRKYPNLKIDIRIFQTFSISDLFMVGKTFSWPHIL
ncbi:hypothetical protein AVEN_213870-1 [Araneus ventricosus]|uniref:Innexin n=1 Tax=Araneus ventricosus TaxID=182803 RepID=A0A4Y2P2A9_ARAVE|nr:hypothetical protein AVEN_91349-1 [Araneus ventricosus]GBN44428.1 hypothetical protein AVEN_158278-1 [Araneus ventricosus]GBN44437.1 hypothetical protein AVEN_178889-1 [Araneus ventricosus]GBN44446.1 hypothetical protein AVEN_213870-1 [Araneus ventricosus]